MANDDQRVLTDGDYGDDPATLVKSRRNGTAGLAVVVACAGVVTMTIAETIYIWTFGLATLVGAAVIGVHASHLDVTRVKILREIASRRHFAQELGLIKAQQAEILDILKLLKDRLDQLENRDARTVTHLGQLAVRIDHAEHAERRLEEELHDIREQADDFARKLGDVIVRMNDQIGPRRRSS